jgi:hypothetical protein
LAHEIDTPHFFDLEISLFSFGREQLERFRIAELARVQVTAKDAAIEKSHDHFLVRRGWSSYFHGNGRAARALRVDRNYVMVSDLLLSSVYFSKV